MVLSFACLLAAACAEAPGQTTQSRALASAEPLADSTWVRLIGELSEPGGYFDTDNLISNEDSYLHVLGGMRAVGVTGGAYVGVGPDQNFSYMAEVRPSLAFMIDVRADNLLQHLWFKALFELSETRLEYLGRMFARPVAQPSESATWTLEEILDALSTPPDAQASAAVIDEVLAHVAGFGLELDDEQRAMLRFIHESFVRGGPGLRFTSHGSRRGNSEYPTYRELLLARDRSGELGNYLRSEESYRVLRTMQLENRVVPVVGDLAGNHALRAIGDEVERRGDVVSVLYTSNVEFYLFQDRSFGRFAENVASLPRNPSSVLIRSLFRRAHPQRLPGFLSTQLLQRTDRFVEEFEAGNLRGYFDVVSIGLEEAR